MKILFSNLPWWESAGNNLRQGIRAGSRWPFTRHAAHAPDNFRFGGYLPAPFFLQYAASYTQREFPEASVTLRDSIARGESYLSFMAYVKREQPDWIVIETATPSWEHDERVIRLIAHESPASKVILCGPMDAAKHKAIGDANRNILGIVQGEPDKQIAKVIRQHEGWTHAQFVSLPPHDLLTLAEMNAAPLPMWDDDCAANYWDGCPIGHEPLQLQIWTSRGCPFRCCFCVWPAVMTGNDPDGTKPRSVRCYSPEYVEALIMSRIQWGFDRGTPYRSIYLDDDTFNLTQKHTLAICGVMKKVGLPWSAMCRADTIDRTAWQLMKDSGCFGVKIGFESGSQEVIDQIVNKRLNLAKARETAIWLRTIGLSVHGTFTVGLPGESEAQKAETLAFIDQLYRDGGLDTHQLSGTATIEGTPLHAIAAGAHLAKYPGARAEGFLVTGDGQRKIEGMRHG
jgi:hypothetical protein